MCNKLTRAVIFVSITAPAALPKPPLLNSSDEKVTRWAEPVDARDVITFTLRKKELKGKKSIP